MEGVLTLLLLVGGFGAIAMMMSLGGALVKRIGTTSPGSADLQRRLAELENRLVAAEEELADQAASTGDRFLEVDDRIEFAERLIQEMRARDRLPKGREDPSPGDATRPNNM